MIYHQGFALKSYLKQNSSVQDIATVLNISRQGVNGLYGQEELSLDYIEKLRAAGHKIPGVTEPAAEFNIGNASGHVNEGAVGYDKSSGRVLTLQAEVENLKKLIIAKDEVIEALRGTIRAYELRK